MNRSTLASQTEDSQNISKLPLPPLAKGVALLGNLMELRRRPLDSIVDIAAELGPIFRLRVGGGEVTVVHSDQGRQIVRSAESLRLNRERIFDAFADQIGIDIFATQGKPHETLRSLINLGYSRNVAACFAPDMAQLVMEEARSWKVGQRLQLFETVGSLAVRQMMVAATPIDLSDRVDDFIRYGSDVMRVIGGLKHANIFWKPAYRRARGRCWKELDSIISRHRAGEFSNQQPTWMTDAFLLARSKEDDALDDRAVRAACSYGLAGAFVYMGPLVTFMLYEALRNRSLLDALHREVDALYADGPLDPTLFRRTAHLRALFFEALRMYILVPGLPFRTTRETEILGYRIPAKHRIIISQIPAHFSEGNFNNPFTFEVDRCLHPRNEHRSKGFAPFGLAPRTCAATGMVEIHVLTAVSAILHTVDLGLLRPTYRTTLSLRPLLSPADGLPVDVLGQRHPDPSASKTFLLQREADMTSALGDEGVPSTDSSGEPVSVAAGEQIIRQGDEALAFYVIICGEVDITRERDGDADSEHLARCGPGEAFGELGLLKQIPRTATVTAATDVELLKIDRNSFLEMVSGPDLTARELGTQLKRRYVKSMFAQALPNLDAQRLAQMVPEFELLSYQPGEDVIVQGGLDEFFFIIVSGVADVILESADGTRRRVSQLESGDYFGEIALQQNRPRTSTVRVCDQGTLNVIRIGRAQFEQLIGSGNHVQQDLQTVICQRLLTNLEAISSSADHSTDASTEDPS